eukprot:Gb_33965 [translate_table: standard]
MIRGGVEKGHFFGEIGGERQADLEGTQHPFHESQGWRLSWREKLLEEKKQKNTRRGGEKHLEEECSLGRSDPKMCGVDLKERGRRRLCTQSKAWWRWRRRKRRQREKDATVHAAEADKECRNFRAHPQRKVAELKKFQKLT